MPFIYQLNLEELHAFDEDSLLPDRGILFFFYKDPEFDQRRSILEPQQADSEESERFLGTGRCKVLYIEDVNEGKKKHGESDFHLTNLKTVRNASAMRSFDR
ncbi:MAG: DUF1963 domain-containing protein [Verrucomicrobiae bacterium]|nr:DUF1963 domain-containing protein [Verrucomicrobiae bacterium]